MQFFWWEGVGLKFIFIVKIQEIQEFVLGVFLPALKQMLQNVLKN